MFRKILVALLAIILGGIAFTLWATDYFRRNRDIPIVSNFTSPTEKEIPKIAIIAQNLDTPWDLAFLPEGDILVTERMGQVKKVNPDTGDTTLIAKIEGVVQNNESGLHGIALHPNFEENNYIYLYYAFTNDNNTTYNRVTRFTLENNTLKNPTTILDNIPSATNHNGGRIRFGPDGYLYIAAGDAARPSLAQETNALAGKILRVTGNGEVAPDNPFGNEVYSYGHRNPQGITWDEKGNLWENEHGPTAHDELNKISKGNNYGWPEIVGDETKDGMQSPVIHSRNETWAPSGNAYLNGSVFFAGLRSNSLFQFNVDTGDITKHLEGEFGRLRGVVRGPDNMLYVTTSNKDGRGVPSPGDDKILRINPEKL